MLPYNHLPFVQAFNVPSPVTKQLRTQKYKSFIIINIQHHSAVIIYTFKYVIIIERASVSHKDPIK